MKENELPQDKMSKMTVCPVKTQISLGIRPVWSESKKALVLSYPFSGQQRLWSDWADAQADLSLRWAQSHFVGFVMRRLKCLGLQNNDSAKNSGWSLKQKVKKIDLYLVKKMNILVNTNVLVVSFSEVISCLTCHRHNSQQDWEKTATEYHETSCR